jgi:hypothetical protein
MFQMFVDREPPISLHPSWSEWLQGVTAHDLTAAVFTALETSGLAFTPVDRALR